MPRHRKQPPKTKTLAQHQRIEPARIIKQATHRAAQDRARHEKLGYTPPARLHREPLRTPDGAIRSSGTIRRKRS